MGSIRPNEIRDLEDFDLLDDPAANETYMQLGFSTLANAAAAAEPADDEPGQARGISARFDPKQPRDDDGKFSTTGGGGGGGGGAGDSVAPSAPASPAQKQRRERLRDRIEGTQAEADLEVKKAADKAKRLEQKLADVKQQIQSLQAAAQAREKAYGELLAKAKADKERKIADSQARLAKRLETIRAKYSKRDIEQELAELEQDASELEILMQEFSSAVAELDGVEADIDSFAKRIADLVKGGS